MLALAFLFAQLSCAFALRMAMDRGVVLKPFAQGRALKIISGLHNLNADNVKNVVLAASTGGASHVDIACNASLVKMAKLHCHLPICVSSIIPKAFVKAVEVGADMVEIGNYDGFYESGLRFSAADIISMTKETRSLLPNIPLSVTIPHSLTLPEQIALAVELERCGADVIQTEGKMGVDPQGLGVQELMEKAVPALASAFALSRAVSIPVMCSSGLTDVTAPLALAAGAKGVGIGSMVNKLSSQQQMYMAVRAIADSMGLKVEDMSQKIAEMKPHDVSTSVSASVKASV